MAKIVPGRGMLMAKTVPIRGSLVVKIFQPGQDTVPSSLFRARCGDCLIDCQFKSRCPSVPHYPMHWDMDQQLPELPHISRQETKTKDRDSDHTHNASNIWYTGRYIGDEATDEVNPLT